MLYASTSVASALLFAVLGLAVPAAESPHVFGMRPDGTPVTQLAAGSPETKVLVLFFVASDCPISNRTFPEMRRLREEYQRRGAAFWYVYPNRGEQQQEVRTHQQAFDAGGEAVLDLSGEMTKLARARVTPEVSVLLPTPAHSWTPVYTGRIDDRYVRLGVERPAATQHFAERAVAQALRGAPVEPATGSPVGCGIIRAVP